MMKLIYVGIASAVLVLNPTVGTAATAMQECLIAGLETADDSMTVGALRQRCERQIAPADGGSGDSLVVEYLRSDRDIENRSYMISLHKQNYILAYSYNSELNLDPWIQSTTPENVDALKEDEAVFQVSAKMPMWRNMFSRNMDLYFAYTQKSWWQIYTDEAELSAPFRDTNYEPEIFARYYSGRQIGRARLSAFDFGYVHQSNGRADIAGGALNRSWDRVMARAVLDWDTFAISLRGWWAFNSADENEDIYKYRGYGDIRAVWAPNKHTFGLMVRPGTEEVGVEASWSWQMNDSLRLYAQYYYGYGEGLLDYAAKSERIGFGVMFNDFLMNQ